MSRARSESSSPPIEPVPCSSPLAPATAAVASCSPPFESLPCSPPLAVASASTLAAPAVATAAVAGAARVGTRTVGKGAAAGERSSAERGAARERRMSSKKKPRSFLDCLKSCVACHEPPESSARSRSRTQPSSVYVKERTPFASSALSAFSSITGCLSRGAASVRQLSPSSLESLQRTFASSACSECPSNAEPPTMRQPDSARTFPKSPSRTFPESPSRTFPDSRTSQGRRVRLLRDGFGHSVRPTGAATGSAAAAKRTVAVSFAKSTSRPRCPASARRAARLRPSPRRAAWNAGPSPPWRV
mmetsp:Transcript_14224/g.36174  ORF Transcript_14224/g.36174 Transcript_14224/m.36174 type:complete len:303 (-) Transcript_14224:167-1075(-)